MSEGKKQLTGDGRYFQTLPPKKEREKKALDEWVNQAMAVFGFKQELKVCEN